MVILISDLFKSDLRNLDLLKFEVKLLNKKIP